MSDMDEGDTPYVGRYCRKCGLKESDIAWEMGGRACPHCKSVWPENLTTRSPYDGGPTLWHWEDHRSVRPSDSPGESMTMTYDQLNDIVHGVADAIDAVAGGTCDREHLNYVLSNYLDDVSIVIEEEEEELEDAIVALIREKLALYEGPPPKDWTPEFDVRRASALTLRALLADIEKLP